MRLFLECKPDEYLARAVGVAKAAIVHGPGKGYVSKSLSKSTGATGLVDQDIGSAQPRTLSEFTEVSANHDLLFKKDKSQNNRLVIVCPRLEEWIIKTAKAAGLQVGHYNLSDKPQELHSDVNHRLPNLGRLLQDLLNAKSPRLLHLKSLLVD